MRPLEDIKIKPSVVAYYLFVSLLVISDSLGNSVLPGYSESAIQQLFLLGQLGCAMLCLFFQCNSGRSVSMFLGMFCIGCAAYLSGGRTGLLLTFLAALLGSSADPDRLLKLVFWEKFVIFLAIVGMSLVGILPGREALFDMANLTEKGITLGYTHANTFSATVVTILLLFAAINRNRFNLLHAAVILGIELVNYYITRARIGLIVVVLLLAAICLCRFPKLRRLILHFARICLWVVLLFNFGFILMRTFADNALLSALDIKIFNGRMGFSAMYLEVYSLSLFGARLDEALIAAKSWYYALDNGYMVILLYYGITGFSAFAILYHKAMLELIRQQQTMLVIIAMCFTVWMMYEGITVSASCNFIFLLLGKTFVPQKEKRRLRIAW